MDVWSRGPVGPAARTALRLSGSRSRLKRCATRRYTSLELRSAAVLFEPPTTAPDRVKFPSFGSPPISIPRCGIPNCNGLLVVQGVVDEAHAALLTVAMLAWLYTSWGVRLIVRACVMGRSSSN